MIHYCHKPIKELKLIIYLLHTNEPGREQWANRPQVSQDSSEPSRQLGLPSQSHDGRFKAKYEEQFFEQDFGSSILLTQSAVPSQNFSAEIQKPSPQDISLFLQSENPIN